MKWQEKLRVCLALFFLMGVLTLAGYTVLRRPTPAEVIAQERMARDWVEKKLNVKITGISCDGEHTCTVSPDGGRPWRAWCNDVTCTALGDR